MTLEQLTAFFCRAATYPSSTQSLRNHFLNPGICTEAAVLLAVVFHQQQWQILLTRRSDGLRQHNGQIAFAGGRRDAQDLNPTDTALRETAEEIGVLPQFWQTFPVLPPHYTPSGYEVHPIPAICTHSPVIHANADEVAEVFYLPLSIALNPAAYGQRTLSYRNQRLASPILPYLHYDIWGLTAIILFSLAERYQSHLATQ